MLGRARTMIRTASETTSDKTPRMTTDQVQSVRPSASKRTIAFRLLLSLPVLGVFVWILHAGALPIVPDGDALRRASKAVIGAYTLFFLALQVLRGIRWYWLLKPFSPVPLKVAIDLTAIGNGALVVLPMRAGEFVRPLLARRYGVSGLAALSTIGAERVIDGLFVGIMLFTALALAPGQPAGFDLAGSTFRDPALIGRAARLALAGFSFALLMLALFRWQQRFMSRLIQSTLGKISHGLALRLTSVLERFAVGLEFLRNRTSASIYIIVSAVYWLLQAGGMWFLLWGCGFYELRLIEAMAITGVFALGFMLPAPPGFFGAFQATLYAGMLLYFSDARVRTDGAAAVFLSYVIQIGGTILFGLIGWLRERRYRGAT
jgi:glycosyltransferase 2 family protein